VKEAKQEKYIPKKSSKKSPAGPLRGQKRAILGEKEKKTGVGDQLHGARKKSKLYLTVPDASAKE